MQKKSNGCLKNVLLLIFCLAMVVAIMFAGSAHTSTTHIAAPSQNWVQQLQQYISSHTTTSKQHATTLTSPSGSCFDQARAAATAAGIDPVLFARQINQESGCTNVVSSAGASGVAQLMPEMATSLGVNTNDTTASLRAGARLMAGYLKKYSGSWALALSCYNAGSGATSYALKTFGNDWLAHMPVETQNYVASILGNGVGA
jgi:soluble lytic murein transglycosylase-like protein